MTWDDLVKLLHQRQQNPGAEAARGFVLGASPVPIIPTEQAKQQLAHLLGLMFGLPAAYDALGQQLGAAGETISHPREALSALGGAVKENPAGAGGMLAGMMLPLGWHRFDPKLGALNEAGEIVRVPGMIRAWDPKRFLYEQANAGLAQEAFAQQIRMARLRGDQMALEKARDAGYVNMIEWRLNRNHSQAKVGEVVAMKDPRGGSEVRYMRSPKGWERLGPLERQ